MLGFEVAVDPSATVVDDFNQKRSLYIRNKFKVNRAAALAERPGQIDEK